MDEVMLRAALDLDELTCALRWYFGSLRDVQRAWQGQLADMRDPLRVLHARLEELRLVRSVEDERIPAQEKNKVIGKLKLCIEEEIKILQLALAQLHARVAHLRELRVRVDGCAQELGWSHLAQCDHFLRGSGATPAPVAMLEWVHDSCLYYQQAILRINNTLSVIVEDDDASWCNLKSAFQEEDESKKQLQVQEEGRLARSGEEHARLHLALATVLCY